MTAPAGPALAGTAARAAATALALLVAACSSDPPEPPVRCPSAVLLQGAERASIHVPGSERRPDDLQLAIALNDLASACQLTGDGLDLALAFNLLAQRGPADPPDPIRISYFLATVGPGEQIVDKQLLDVELSLPPDREVIGMRETVTLRLPGVGEAEAAGYRVYVGLQLDETVQRPRDAPPAGGL